MKFAHGMAIPVSVVLSLSGITFAQQTPPPNSPAASQSEGRIRRACFERQVLKGMQRIVMHECRDGALGRKQVGGMLNRAGDFLHPFAPSERIGGAVHFIDKDLTH